jgi:hypothetical protein
VGVRSATVMDARRAITKRTGTEAGVAARVTAHGTGHTAGHAASHMFGPTEIKQAIRGNTRCYCAFLARRMSSSMRSPKPGCEARGAGGADRSSASGDGGPIGSGERAG